MIEITADTAIATLIASVKAAPACSTSAVAAAGSSVCDTPSAAPTDSLAAPAASGGSFATSTLVRYADDTMLPRMAMPSAPPSSRVVSLTAEPTPALLSGTDDMIAPVAGGIVNAMPPASNMSASMITRYGVSGARNAMITNPAAIPEKPVATTRFSPSRATSPALRGATMNIMSANGNVAMP